MDITSLIFEFNNSLKNLYSDFKGIYLFGSRATNTQTKDSDIDLVLMFSKIDKNKKLSAYSIISDLMYKYNIFIDAKLMDDNSLEYNPFFYDEIKKNGVFYGAK